MRAQADLTVKISFFSNCHTLLLSVESEIDKFHSTSARRDSIRWHSLFSASCMTPHLAIHANERVCYDHADLLCSVTMT